ncbi:MAG: hypothetical protein ACRC0A_03790 [Chitinophagaceae bacterium]
MYKKNIVTQLVVAGILMHLLMISCQKENKADSAPPPITGEMIGNGDKDFEITKDFTIPKGVYLLKGWVYVTKGTTLTIEPGTIIKGEKATSASLIIEPGAKLIAKGTKEEPIVFTSASPKGKRLPGDWGGLILCGNARNNAQGGVMQIEGGPRTRHGGKDDNDNSGILQYVRVEFAGAPFQTDTEINGLTLGSVGSGTTIDHVQVSYCNDDSYEWFGGTVDCKYIVAYHGWDDDFDTDEGYRGRGQFWLSIRHPKIADRSRSNGSESDNNPEGSGAQPVTAPILSNVTFIGPKSQASDFSNNSTYIDGGGVDPRNGSALGAFQAALHIRRNSRLSCYNSIAVGYPVGLIIENDKISKTQDGASEMVDIDNGKFAIKNVVFGDYDILGSDKNGSYKNSLCKDGLNLDTTKLSFSDTYYSTPILNNVIDITALDLFLQPNSLIANTNYGPKPGSILLNKTGLFADKALQDVFFIEVDYIGAFKSDSPDDDWTAGWCNFDPQNTDY